MGDLSKIKFLAKIPVLLGFGIIGSGVIMAGLIDVTIYFPRYIVGALIVMSSSLAIYPWTQRRHSLFDRQRRGGYLLIGIGLYVITGSI